MIFYFLSYLGGFITILSPCILPVLPFVFARADRSFRQSGLPLLLGMAITFTVFSTLAVIGGGWVVAASQWGRWVALALLLFFGVSLIFPHFLEILLSPLARWGGRVSGTNEQASWPQSLLLGMATGLLWAPCAGPILGLILTAAAIKGGSQGAWSSASYLFAYALGAATSLALALAAGGKLLGTLKKYLRAERMVRVILGGLVILAVLAISLNWDRDLLTKVAKVQTDTWEQKLLQTFHSGATPEKTSPAVEADSLPVEGELPEISGATHWLNSPPLSRESLKGKVVLVDFWTYSCINCLRTLPYVKAWVEKYKDAGLVVIGVHTPEFAFEKDLENVSKAVHDLGVTYPVALDNDYKIWNAFQNNYWPAHYFIDRQGHIRHHHFGEGEYARSEQILQRLLADGAPLKETSLVEVHGQGAQARPELTELKSPETYIGDRRAENRVIDFQAGMPLQLNQWALVGDWKVDEEKAVLQKPHGKIFFRFHARDLHLVLGAPAGKEIRFRVRLDGHPLADNHGADTDSQGDGVVKEQRLYQLIRQQTTAPVQDHTFEIEFLDSGVQAFAFTFG
jgi:cytochrome c biogenesis protein CcdA/thiol-disulfide isomerase/thioredoxin